MQRRSARLLRTRNHEIESLDCLPFSPKHRTNRAPAVPRCLRAKFPVTANPNPPSQRLMLQALAFGSELLLIAEFTLILIALLLFSLMTIPGRVRRPKR